MGKSRIPSREKKKKAVHKPDKTKIYFVALRYITLRKGYYIVCSEKQLTGILPGTMLRFRKISPTAAVRHYVKHNLNSLLYAMDDGHHDASQINEMRKPLRKNETKYIAGLSKRRMVRDDNGKIHVEYID